MSFMKKYFKAMGNSILFLIIFYFVQTIFCFILGIVLAMANGINGSKEKLNELINQNVYIPLGLGALISILIFYLMLKNKEEGFSVRCKFKKVKPKFLVNVIVMALSLGALSTSLVYLFGDKFKSYSEVSKTLGASLDSIGGIIVIILIVPIAEEILFRGVIFNELKKEFNIIVSVIIQALFFAVAHGNVLQGIYAFVLGSFAAVIYLWSDSIISNIALHITFNLAGTFIFPILIYYTSKYVAVYVVLGLLFLGFAAINLYRGTVSTVKEVKVYD